MIGRGGLCVAVVGFALAGAFGCGDNQRDETTTVVVAPEPEDTVSDDPMSVIPDDIVLWEAFRAKRILKQPDTNTLVVEGTVPGVAADLAQDLETSAKESGWTPVTLTKNDGLSTLIMSKGARRLKVNLTQEGDSASVYLTTRLPS